MVPSLVLAITITNLHRHISDSLFYTALNTLPFLLYVYSSVVKHSRTSCAGAHVEPCSSGYRWYTGSANVEGE